MTRYIVPRSTEPVQPADAGQAARRNHASIDADRVELILGGLDLGGRIGQYNAVLSGT